MSGGNSSGLRSTARAAPSPEPAGSATSASFTFAGALTQGGWLRGQAPGGTVSARIDGEPLVLDGAGRFFAALDRDTHALPEALQRFGESTLEFLCTEAAIQMQRAIIAEAGRSDIGLRFFEMGPQKARHDLAHFLEGQMALGRLRRADPLLVAIQLIALLECETVTPCLFGVVQRLSKAQIRQAVQRALGTFLAAHGSAAMAGPPPPPAS